MQHRPHAVRLTHYRADDADDPGALRPRGTSFGDTRANAGPLVGGSNGALSDADVIVFVALRERAIITMMTPTFARIGAVEGLTIEDYFSLNKRWLLLLHEKTVS